MSSAPISGPRRTDEETEAGDVAGARLAPETAVTQVLALGPAAVT